MSVFISEGAASSNPYLRHVRVVQGDIIAQSTDAIVTLIPQTLEYSGGINQAIEAATGTEMHEFIRENFISPRAGDIYAAPGFNLPCKHILFCVVPVWRDDWDRNDRQLLNACRKAVELSRRMSLKTIAFPPIGSGRRAFPKTRAARLILQAIADRMDDSFEEIRIVCQNAKTKRIFDERLQLDRF